MHSIKTRLVSTAAISLTIFLNFAGSVKACGPDYPRAVLFSWNHPDMPMKPFAGGNLGVVFETYAKSYLCVAYRYLSDKPLSTEEQASVDHMWTARLKLEGAYLADDDCYPTLNYFELRAKSLNTKDSTDAFKLQQKNGISDDAFHQALSTLRKLVKRYGQKSPAVKDWILAQDKVFGVNSGFKISVPAKLSSGIASDLVTYRDYQIAAAQFYLGNHGASQKLFSQLAQKSAVPEIQRLAAYMEARIATSEMLGASYGEKNVPRNLNRIRNYANRAKDAQSKFDIIDLESFLLADNLSQDDNLRRIVDSILKVNKGSDYELGDSGLGRNIWDLSYLLEQDVAPVSKTDRSKYDLIDWLDTVNSGIPDYYMFAYPSPEEAKAIADKQNKRRLHALEQWRKTHSKAWLVAVMVCGGLRGDDVDDAIKASEQLQSGDPAFLTSRFYLIDRLINQKHFLEARLMLQSLKYGSMPVSTFNLFKAQQLATSDSIDGFFTAACMPVSAAATNLLLVDDDRWHHWNAPRKNLSTFDTQVGQDLDRYLPWEKWQEFSHRKDLPGNLRQRILCAVWIKAKLLGKAIDESKLLNELSSYCSKATAAKIVRYENAKSSDEKQFLFAQILLDNYGMSPYVKEGLPRFADKIDTFNYYQQNYWLPITAEPTAEELKKNADDYSDGSVAERITRSISLMLQQYYSTQKVNKLLTPAQVADARAEIKTIEKQHPSKVLGSAILNWARLHPNDPDVPVYLYKIVRLPKWSGESDIGSEYSRAAYLALHRNYPTSKWTKQAVCWY